MCDYELAVHPPSTPAHAGRSRRRESGRGAVLLYPRARGEVAGARGDEVYARPLPPRTRGGRLLLGVLGSVAEPLPPRTRGGR